MCCNTEINNIPKHALRSLLSIPLYSVTELYEGILGFVTKWLITKPFSEVFPFTVNLPIPFSNSHTLLTKENHTRLRSWIGNNGLPKPTLLSGWSIQYRMGNDVSLQAITIEYRRQYYCRRFPAANVNAQQWPIDQWPIRHHCVLNPSIACRNYQLTLTSLLLRFPHMNAVCALVWLINTSGWPSYRLPVLRVVVSLRNQSIFKIFIQNHGLVGNYYDRMLYLSSIWLNVFFCTFTDNIKDIQGGIV